MRVKYANPPLVEALCEFRFATGQPWDWTIPGLVFNKIKEKYPVKKEVKRVGFEFKAIKVDFESRVVQGTERMQFLNKEENRLVQVGKNLLTINQLIPYNSWTEFKSRINSAVQTYAEIVNPMGIINLGLRYINRIQLPETFVMENFFNYYPKFPDEDQHVIGPLHLMSTLPFPNIPEMEGTMNLIFAIEPPSKDNTYQTCVLDLDMIYKWKKSTPLIINKVDLQIEKAHRIVQEMFESCITNKLRQKFE